MVLQTDQETRTADLQQTNEIGKTENSRQNCTADSREKHLWEDNYHESAEEH